jgi:hypothetical protein
MVSEIGSWRRHENSVRFVGGRRREEGADRLIVGRSGHSKHYAVDRDGRGFHVQILSD